jgi:hypothetical protein
MGAASVDPTAPVTLAIVNERDASLSSRDKEFNKY